MTTANVPRKLTNAQVALLDLMSINLSDSELNDLRRVLMQHFRSKLDEEVDKVLERRGQTVQEMERTMNFDNRTERLQVIRKQRTSE